MCLGQHAMAAVQPPPASVPMFVTPTLCRHAVDGRFRGDES
jgi:hypothetical protein